MSEQVDLVKPSAEQPQANQPESSHASARIGKALLILALAAGAREAVGQIYQHVELSDDKHTVAEMSADISAQQEELANATDPNKATGIKQRIAADKVARKNAQQELNNPDSVKDDGLALGDVFGGIISLGAAYEMLEMAEDKRRSVIVSHASEQKSDSSS